MAAPYLDSRLTERRNPRTVAIDLAEPLEIVDLINAEDRTVADTVAGQREAIARAVALAEATFRAGGRLFYAGAGTSGRLGVLDSVELNPTFSWPHGRAVALLAGGAEAMFVAVEGAEDDLEQGAADLKSVDVGPDDVVLLLAASGHTPYVLGALRAARSPARRRSARRRRSSPARRRPRRRSRTPTSRSAP